MAEVNLTVWHKRIQAARKRRQLHESKWAFYAWLHAKAESFARQENDDVGVLLPNGDQVRVGLIHRNVEQTMGLLEVPEIGVRATAMDDGRGLDISDTHRESVVEQALVNSSKKSGLIKRSEEVDYIKRDGIVVGHGICYSWYRVERREREVGRAIVATEKAGGDGPFPEYEPELDDQTGEPKTESITETETVYQACQDEHVPVLEFLFESTANRMDTARWHGREQIVALDELRDDPRYNVPDDLEPSSFKTKNLYGEEPEESVQLEADSVRKITIWDKCTQQLLSFIESPKRKDSSKAADPAELNLLLIGQEDWPVTFQHPDDSPFSFFIPIPANDMPFGISQIEHTRNSSLEADKLRTRQANITRQIKRLLFARRGVIDKEQFQDAIAQPDMSVVEIDIPEDFDAKRDLFELPIPTVHPDIYGQQKAAEEDVRTTSGISDLPFGGASTATESDNMMAVGGARPNRKRRLYLKFLSTVLGHHRDYLREWSPPGQVVVVPGDDGLPIPMVYGREAFAGEFDIEVQAGGEAMTVSPVKQKILIEVGNLAFGKVSPQFDRLFLRQILTMLDFRDINRLLSSIPQQGGMYAPGGLPMPGAPPGAPPGVDGKLRQDHVNAMAYTNGQAIREGINAPNEGRIAT